MVQSNHITLARGLPHDLENRLDKRVLHLRQKFIQPRLEESH